MSVPLRTVGDDDPGNTLRVPPHNYEAERALLGALLMNNHAFERVSEFLAPGYFADPVNGRIYQAISLLVDQGKQANPVSLKNYLENDDLIVSAGGMKYLANLAAGAVTVVNTADYGKLIYDLYLRRELIALGEDVVNEAFDSKMDESAADLIDKAETQLFSLRQDGSTTGDLVDFDFVADEALELAERAYRHDGTLVGITTGLRDLDRKIGGLQNSDVLIIAGRPSSGKTAIAVTIAHNAAKYFATTDREDHKGKQVAFFSLEMSRDQLMTRIFAHESQLDSFSIKTGRLNEEEFERLIMARQRLREMPLRIDHTPAATVAQIRSRARRLARKGKLGAIVIDYLQLISPPGRERAENRVNELSMITRGLKTLAKELDVPVIALSQLNRGVELREDKRPMLSDLRESGSIEADSDVVMFVYRDQYYLERAEPKQRTDETTERYVERFTKWQNMMNEAHGKGELIIAKQRHGPLGTIALHFEEKHAWWADLVSIDLPEDNRLL